MAVSLAQGGIGLAAALCYVAFSEAGRRGTGLAVVWVALVACAAIAWWWWDRPIDLAAQRRASGQCPYCGYDLTGNVSGVCPECGRAR